MSGQTNDELWSVALPSGDIQRGTLDQLDDAFNAGLITRDSLVLAPGATAWAKLGDLADLDGAHETTPTAPMTAFAPTVPTTLRPVAIALDDVEPSQLRASRKPLVFGVLGGVAAIAAVAFFAVNGAGPSDTRAAAAALTAAALTAAPKPSAAPPPVAPEVSARPLLTDEQKKALLDADEARSRLLKNKRAQQEANQPYAPSKGIRDSAGFGGPRKPGKCTCRAGDPLCSCM